MWGERGDRGGGRRKKNISAVNRAQEGRRESEGEGGRKIGEEGGVVQEEKKGKRGNMRN